MFICLSAEYYTNNKQQNKSATNDLNKDLKSFQFKYSPIKGKYKGVTEKSFIVKVETYQDIVNLQMLGNKYNQESILFVDKSNKAMLIYCVDGKTQTLGNFSNVVKTEAVTQDAYSIIGSKYFIVR